MVVQNLRKKNLVKTEPCTRNASELHYLYMNDDGVDNKMSNMFKFYIITLVVCFVCSLNASHRFKHIFESIRIVSIQFLFSNERIQFHFNRLFHLISFFIIQIDSVWVEMWFVYSRLTRYLGIGVRWAIRVGFRFVTRHRGDNAWTSVHIRL